MKIPMNPEAVRAATKWWRDAISTPRFDNGDPSFAGFTASVLASDVARSRSVTPEQLDAFEAALADAIREDWEGRNWHNEHTDVTLATDYHPGHLLASAAGASGIDEHRFPWKTCMRVHPAKVEVTGYRVNFKPIWVADAGREGEEE